MKKYFNSLLPYRWFLLLIFNVLSMTPLLMLLIINKIWFFPYGWIYILSNIIFWFVIDYVLGLGQENVWERNKNK